MSGPDLRAAVRAYFDGAVREWDTGRYADPTYVGRARLALRWLRRMGRGKRVLDLGCGTGRQSAAALRAGDRVVSADFSIEMARATRDRIARECPGAASAVVVADALHPPFRPGAFDAVMALGVLGFVPDREAMLRESRGLLRPGGALVCDVGVPERRVALHALGAALDRPLAALARAWRRFVLRRPPGPPAGGEPGWYRRHFVKHAPDEIEAMLRAAGLSPRARGGAGLGELRVMGRLVVPWRVQRAATRIAARLSALPGGGWLARRSLTYVVCATRDEGAPASPPAMHSDPPSPARADPSPVPDPVPARGPARPHPLPAQADAPALRGQLRQ